MHPGIPMRAPERRLGTLDGDKGYVVARLGVCHTIESKLSAIIIIIIITISGWGEVPALFLTHMVT